MAISYEFGLNPIKDFLVNLLLKEVDIEKKENINEMYEIIFNFISNISEDENDLVFLDYKIKVVDGIYVVIPENIVTALWFTGIFPINCENVYNENICEYKDIKFSFDKKKKILTKTNKLI